MFQGETNLSLIELEKLKGLIHPLDDTIQMCIDVIEIYTKKLEPGARFEVRNACRALKDVQNSTLRSVAALIRTVEQVNIDRAAAVRKERRLLSLQCKAAAFATLAQIIEHQRQAIDEQVKREVNRSRISGRKG